MNTIKKIFKHIMSTFKRFIPLLRFYGFSVAFWSFVFCFKHLYLRRLRLFFAIKKHKSILKYLDKHYSYVFNKYLQKEDTKDFIGETAPIWVCWWDGKEVMPPIVKICFNSIKSHAVDHPIRLITKNNYKDFISIPDFIMKKVDLQIITITHFSDILRVNLLHNYGGIWIDATVFCLKDISFDNLPFYTLKSTNETFSISHIPLLAPSYSKLNPYDTSIPDVNYWSGFLLAGCKQSIIFSLLRDLLYEYWKEHNDQIDYFLIDYFIALGYANIPNIKKMIDDVPCLNYDKFALGKELNIEYSETDFKKYCEKTFHKLSWKEKFKEYTNDGKLSNYGYLNHSYLSTENQVGR